MPDQPNNHRRIWVCFFLLSVLAQLTFHSLVGNPESRYQPVDYQAFYEPVADNLLHGNGFTINGHLAIRYPPGYPMILAAIFEVAELLSVERLRLVTVFNILAMAFSCSLLFAIARSFFSQRIAFLSALAWVTYPFGLWLAQHPNTEIPFILLLYLGVWSYISALKSRMSSAFMVVGLLLGSASLVRPAGALLGLLFSALLLLRRQTPLSARILPAALLMAGNLAVVIPWEGYVYSKSGQLVFFSTGGPPSIVDGLTFAIKPGAGGDQVPLPKDVQKFMHQVDAECSDLTTMGCIFSACLQQLLDRPMAVLKLLLIKSARSWYATDEMWHEKEILAIQSLYLTTGIAGMGLAIRKHKEARFYIALLGSIVLYFWAVAIAALSILRYMIPVMGFVVAFSAISVDKVIGWWRGHGLCLELDGL